MRFAAVLNFLGNKSDCVIFLIKNVRECPGSPMVVTLHFHCQGGWLALIPQTVWCGQKKKKKFEKPYLVIQTTLPVQTVQSGILSLRVDSISKWYNYLVSISIPNRLIAIFFFVNIIMDNRHIEKLSF